MVLALGLLSTTLADELMPRLVVLTDIAPNHVDPDDMESMIRLRAHADLFEIEALVATTGWSNTGGSNHAESTFTTVNVSESSGFRYVRDRVPNDGWGNVAQGECRGCACTEVSGNCTLVSRGAGLEAIVESDTQVNRLWNASAHADTYSIKRSTISGAAHVVKASNLTTTAYSDTTGLTAGARYYYVVYAMNVGGARGGSTVERL